ncbi:hypothetical protein CANARDRAFT_109577 [[Candida] arabinofermentans NRRL YB-2248]|uniref:Uncharacterized protein n=1 Tax=[Candida] arabinofermentans NRRL YB-2248 TaxID=983967 RepID=A0A1E4STF7_9ASCO|nr:hypothetical protein CANARDRAFT_109577 [[Candida] arabinofermentans NRRL YB-2248]
MADFSELKPIITNTKKRGKNRTLQEPAPLRIAEEGSAEETFTDELVIGNASGKATGKAKPKRRESKYATLGDLDNKDSEDEPFDDKKWAKLIGFVSIRVISPLILILHCLSTILYIWYYHSFTIDDELLSKMPYIMGPLSLNLFAVHFFNKWFFRNTFYKPRVPENTQ